MSDRYRVLQIRRGITDNLGIISHILHKNIVYDPSLEPSRQDGSKEGSQHRFSLRNKKKNFELSSNTRSYLELWVYQSSR